MLHCVVEFCAAVLYVVMCSCMLCSVVRCNRELLHECSVVRCYQELLHAGQCCYMLHCVVEFCAAVLYVVMCSCMLCSVVTCYQEFIT